MYNYNDKNSIEYRVNIYINESMNCESVYRIILFNGKMFIIFNNTDLLNEFMNKYISKYTCDTSGSTIYGLSIIMSDYMAISSILNKVGYGSKKVSK